MRKQRTIFKLRIVAVMCILAYSINAFAALELKEMPFWYAEPATDWKSAIPIGNGRIGGMIFGDPVKEQIVLNESSIWCGPPVPPNNPNGPELITKMRQLLFSGDYLQAEAICNNEFLDRVHENARAYQPFGFLEMNYADEGEISNYKRWIDYTTAVTYVTYKQNNITYTREAFVSAPDQVMVVRLSADRSGKISFTSNFTRPFGATSKVEKGNSLYIQGKAYSEEGDFQGVEFDGIIKFIHEGGKLKHTNDGIQIENANSVTILTAINTNYNIQNPSSPLVRNRKKTCEAQISQAVRKGFTRLKQTHINDYSGVYNRSSFSIEYNVSSKTDIPINQRIKMAAEGNADPDLLFVYYHYARYVFISGSRAGGLPFNLQGIWNPLMLPPWRSNFHINVNQQIAYWFAEQANLSDCHEPLFTLTERLAENGQETAQKMLGVNRGTAFGHRTDAWFYTAMTGSDACHGMYIISNGWLAQHMMEHYRFTMDQNFLRERAYPVIRKTALFFVDWLVRDPRSGKLVSGPSASAENKFLIDDKRVSLTMGPSQDQEIIWNTFRDYLQACSILGISTDETREVQNALNNLALPKIGSDGRLLEWSEELTESELGHRHLSHLWGMMPGNRITQDKTPYLVDAVRKSLDFRLANKYAAQGWSLGWVTCMLARLREGDRCLDMMEHKYFTKSYPNMFVDAHHRVQVGDMMGISLAMIELILQSHTDYIDLLPSLPAAWKNGKVTGLCARGAFVFDMEWKDGKLISTNIKSLKGGKCLLRYEGKVKELSTEAGKSYQVTF